MTEKKLDVSSYGIYLLSIDKLTVFLKENKIRSRKILEFFQKNHELYLKSLEQGVWLPILPIDSMEYIIKFDNSEKFDSNWEKVFNIDEFNLEIGNDNSFWVGSIGNLLKFEVENYLNNTEDCNSYSTLDGEILYDSFKFNIENGKYLVNIIGYKRKSALEYPEANYGYSFEFKKVEQFIGYKDPREDDKYVFNLSTY
ncbi:hypothetical protein C3B47_14065 [Flavobacterium columnare]|uniref:Uncharacterized protein n=2 Tax=Flavobacterium columnare TaxID=996 RepID=G8XAJ3_FLACA|nr:MULTISPECIES: hypothetical protein [Flavobacterium]AEW86664.1 hypothetical protein FCOL_09275 [Flavobacterium columnare ATCC 49512]AMO20557.1 hypothetical protein UN65_09640 [Flavobacterium columnare]AUX18528.1 hypothetical protein AQ623_09785 [Flavobacterium columnare]MBF6653980.1 hypothetical protein [Flavobacterium columnare]MBF6656624.1 hypothetical protein [Flavobacterium columnare]